ncbi:4-coumarate-CoA ligase [Acrasis kona]|uniref:4-coumarate-CoA ligase n=1 Tax=Acrasis kona TaxID=1008807 RepID=A0AAW2ZIP2_9EUKA
MIHQSRFDSVNIPDDVSLTDFVLSKVHRHRDKPFMIDSADGSVITFGETRQLIHNVVFNLINEHEFGCGQVMAILLPNVTLYPILYLGIARSGGASSTINPLYTDEEIKKQLITSNARFIVTNTANQEKVLKSITGTSVEKVFVIGGDSSKNTLPISSLLKDINVTHLLPKNVKNPKKHIVCIPFSSGTTGVNKGVLISHYNIISNLCQAEVYGQVTDKDVMIGFLPYFHIYGQILIMLQSLYSGATIVNVEKFDFDVFLKLIEKYKITHAKIVPPVMLQFAKHPNLDHYNLSSLKRLFCGAAPLSGELTSIVHQRLPGVDIVQAYGMTELATAVTCAESHKARDGSAGILMPNVQMKIIDLTGSDVEGYNKEGELAFKTPSAMLGYLNNEEATQSTIVDGWLHTGDIGYIDKDGYVYVVDRVKELIKYKGFQVPPAELEGLLLKHECIQDCAVVGVPDEAAGELPKAFVVKKQGHDLNEEQVISYIAQHVNPQKKIRMVQFIDSIPKSATGKILRRLLRTSQVSKL